MILLFIITAFGSLGIGYWIGFERGYMRSAIFYRKILGHIAMMQIQEVFAEKKPDGAKS